jgi:outer membrane receptor protein involved in Fe transport
MSTLTSRDLNLTSSTDTTSRFTLSYVWFAVAMTVLTGVYVSYRVTAQNRWLNDTHLRLGVNNLFDAKPPLSADSRGYEVGLYNTMARGLTWSFQATKKL